MPLLTYFSWVGLALGWGVRRFHNNIYVFPDPTELGQSQTPHYSMGCPGIKIGVVGHTPVDARVCGYPGIKTLFWLYSDRYPSTSRVYTLLNTMAYPGMKTS